MIQTLCLRKKIVLGPDPWPLPLLPDSSLHKGMQTSHAACGIWPAAAAFDGKEVENFHFLGFLPPGISGGLPQAPWPFFVRLAATVTGSKELICAIESMESFGQARVSATEVGRRAGPVSCLACTNRKKLTHMLRKSLSFASARGYSIALSAVI